MTLLWLFYGSIMAHFRTDDIWKTSSILTQLGAPKASLVWKHLWQKHFMTKKLYMTKKLHLVYKQTQSVPELVFYYLFKFQMLVL